MPELPPSYRVEPDTEFADQLQVALLQRLTAPTSSRSTELQRVATVAPIEITPSWIGDDDASNDLDPSVADRRLARRRLATRIALGTAAAALLVMTLTAVIRPDHRQNPNDQPPSTLAIAPETGQQTTPFEGTWVSTDIDGSTQTMEIDRSGSDLEVVVRDDFARVCSGAPSTMTGLGRLDGEGALVLPQPLLSCDNGDQPVALSGPPIDEQLADFTFTHAVTSDELEDNFGITWQRPDEEAGPEISGGMWPQSTLDEVRAAQALADAGNPAYTWQVDPQLASEAGWSHLNDPGAAIVERFLRDELGWEEFAFDEFRELFGELNTSGPDGYHRGVTFLRCAPGAPNPLYPASADQPRGVRCAPTIDELRYETVSLDLSQPERLGTDGIWVVSGWRVTAPFTQADPRVVEADATALLENFLRARIDGVGAEAYTLSSVVPLLYATTTGAGYERFEIERTSEPRWPHGGMKFTVRLFADGGETVVEQPISFDVDGSVAGDGQPPKVTYSYWHSPSETTENGQPVPVPNEFLDGSVTISAAAPWLRSLHFTAALATDDQALERLALTVDSLRVGCGPIPNEAKAAALAVRVQADPDLVATAPVAVTISGIAGLQMDVTLAAQATACPEGRTGNDPNPENRVRGTGFPLEQGSRMRLVLLDVPEGSTTRVLAIAVVAPDARFGAVLDTATSIVDSIEFQSFDLTIDGALPEELRDFLASEFGLAVEAAPEEADSFDTLERVEDEIANQRSDWSDDAEISVYLGRRIDDGGLVDIDQWPVAETVWVVDVTNAGVPRGEGLGVVGRVVLVYDAETGESLTYFEAAPDGS